MGHVLRFCSLVKGGVRKCTVREEHSILGLVQKYVQGSFRLNLFSI